MPIFGRRGATDWHVIHLGNLALSGAALLISEATAVSPGGRINPDDPGLWSDETEAALGRVLSIVRRYSDMPVAIQLAHAGRKGSTRVPWEGGKQIRPDEPRGWQTVAPSPLPFAAGDHPPRTITYDPRWPWRAAAHFGATVKAPKQYLRSQPARYRNLFEG